MSRISKTFDYEGITFRRNQIPLVPAPAYVITDYIIDIRISPDGRWNIFHGGYVMMSRVSNSNGLHILSQFSRDELKNVRPPRIIVNEFKRLQEIEHKSFANPST